MEHWFGNPVSDFFLTGRLGVSLFFTISGFLITQILLRRKQAIAAGKESRSGALKTFYIRRSLRIFPIYYLTLIFLLFTLYPGLKEKVLWYFLYGSNIYSFIHQKWDGALGPFWSLAVEEQFYLLWPFLILLIPFNKIKHLLWACVILAPIFRAISLLIAQQISQQPDNYLSMEVLTPACIDAFAFGGLLALNIENPAALKSRVQQFIFNSRILGLCICCGCLALFFIKDNVIFYLFFPTLFSFCMYKLIRAFTTGVKGYCGTVIDFKPFIYLGKISYGLYIFHAVFFAIFALFDWLFFKTGIRFSFDRFIGSPNRFAGGLFMILSLVILASISYYLIEKPFMSLKRKYT